MSAAVPRKHISSTDLIRLRECQSGRPSARLEPRPARFDAGEPPPRNSDEFSRNLDSGCVQGQIALPGSCWWTRSNGWPDH